MKPFANSCSLKKTIALVLVACCVVSPTAAYASSFGGNYASLFEGDLHAVDLMSALQFSDLHPDQKTGPLFGLAAQGIIKGDGSGRFNPNMPVTKEQAVVALVRLLGWEDKAIASTAKATSNTNASSWAAGPISYAISRGITVNAANRNGNTDGWETAVERQELALWLMQALTIMGTSLPTDSAVGPALFSDADEIDPQLKSSLLLAMEYGLLSPTEPGLLAPSGEVTRLELAMMFHRLIRLLPPSPGATWEVGVIEDLIVDIEEIAGLPAQTYTYTITKPGGSKVALKLSYNHRNLPLAQTIVYKDGALGYGNILKPGDTVRYLVQTGRKIPFMEVLTPGAARINGRIEQINKVTKKLVIKDINHSIRHLALASMPSVIINGYKASVDDLIAGQQVAGLVFDDLIYHIAVDTPFNDYDIDPPAMAVSGKVRMVDEQSVLLVLPDGSTAQYSLSANTKVMVQTKLSSCAAIKTGDLVEIQLSSPSSTWAQQITVASPEMQSVYLVRGRLGAFPPRGDYLILTNLQILDSGIWQNEANTILLPLRAGSNIWFENSPITLELAARLTGAEVYAAISSGYGRPEIVAATMWTGQEKSYEGTIDKINPALGLVSLASAEFVLSPGAIVIRDGRLADHYGLQKGDSIQALVNRSGEDNSGLVVSVLGGGEGNIEHLDVYRGRIDDLGKTALTLGHYQTFSTGGWTSRRRGTTDDIGLGRDTLILSLLGDKPAELSVEQLRQGLWQQQYEDVDTLAVVENDYALALALWHGGELNSARLGKATVDRVGSLSADLTETIDVDLRNVLDYSTAKETWQNTGEIQLRFDQAVVIKDGRAFTNEALRPGDNILFLRRGQTVLMALVKE